MTTTFMIENFSENKLRDKTKLNNSKVRGKTLASTINFIKTEFKESGFEKVISDLDISLQITLRKNIDLNDWYSSSYLVDLSIKVADVFFKGDLKSLQKIGHFVGNQLISGFTGIKLKLNSLEKNIEFIKNTIEWHYLPASVSIISSDSKHVVIECEKLFDPTHTLIYRFVGITKAVLENKGLKNVQLSYEISSTKEDTYIIQAIWSN